MNKRECRLMGVALHIAIASEWELIFAYSTPSWMPVGADNRRVIRACRNRIERFKALGVKLSENIETKP